MIRLIWVHRQHREPPNHDGRNIQSIYEAYDLHRPSRAPLATITRQYRSSRWVMDITDDEQALDPVPSLALAKAMVLTRVNRLAESVR